MPRKSLVVALALLAVSLDPAEGAPHKAGVALAPEARPELREPCGTTFTPAEAIAYLEHLENRGDVAVPRGFDPPYYVPIAPHIVRRSNGTGGLPLSRYEQAVVDANAHFADTDIVFYTLGPIDYIDSDFYYFNVNTGEEIDDLRTQNLVPGAINIYFTENLPYCGVSAFSFSSVQSILMKNSCTASDSGLGNHSTFSHEIGHFFDLFHTHETFYGDEYVDGSNCGSAGDLVCDTPADPQLSSSIVTEGCVYTGTETDPQGDPYDPDPTQLMSYSRKHCRDNFSPGSESRIVDTLWAERIGLITNPVSAPAVRPGGVESAVALAPPRPNPTSGSTGIDFTLERSGHVEVTIYDVRGARVTTLTRGERSAGVHSLEWNGLDSGGSPVAPGIYFVRLDALGIELTRKVQRAR